MLNWESVESSFMWKGLLAVVEEDSACFLQDFLEDLFLLLLEDETDCLYFHFFESVS